MCQLISPDDIRTGRKAISGGRRCRGTEVVKQTGAAVLVEEVGKWVEVVIDEEMADWRRNDSGR